MTETEKLMLANRLALIILLEEGLPGSQIAEIPHVTRDTAAKMCFYYEARGKGFKTALTKLEKEEQFLAFKNMLISLTRYSINAAGGSRIKIKKPY